MKSISKYLYLVAIAFALSSCEINDRLLERSDSSIYNKLMGDKDNSATPVDPNGSNHIVGDANYDSRITMSIADECTLAESYACMLNLTGVTTGYKYYVSEKLLTVKEALSYLTSRTLNEYSNINIVDTGLARIERYLYILPCDGTKYGDITVLSLPAASSEGFSDNISIVKSEYVDLYNIVTLAPSKYQFRCAVILKSEYNVVSSTTDAALALLLERTGKSYNPTDSNMEVTGYNPEHQQAVAVVRTTDNRGVKSNTITRKTLN
ncbi:MAG: hypothetical protein HDR88_02665 [Bacteroides sp.]|nr:hypothetical protein [Bacteroides sp.]